MELSERKTISAEGIDYREVVGIVLNKWYWFLLSVVICLGIAYLYTARISPLYAQNAVILVKGNDKKADPNSMLLELSSEFSIKGVDNDLYILRSHQLLRKVTELLRLDITYEIDKGFRRDPLYDDESPIQVVFPFIHYSHVSMEIIPVDEKTFRIASVSENNWKIEGEKNYGEKIVTPLGEMVINPIAKNLPKYIKKSIFVTFQSIESATYVNQAKITTSLVDKQTTLVKIVCSDTNISRAKAILNTLIEVYNETIVEDKNRIAANTAEFIEERIGIISRELGDVEEELTSFRQRNRIINISSSASQYLSESSKVKEESTTLETQLTVARYIRSYLSDATRTNQLIPNVSGIGDIGIQNQIQSYNELLTQCDRILANSGENNPIVKEMNAKLTAMRETISGSMDNYINTLNVRLSKARSVENQLLSNIQSVPKQEKMALSIMRQQAIKESLYTFLLNKREENALQLAITVANIRVVETPFGSSAPIAPSWTRILFAAFILGLIIPSGILWLYLTLNTTIRGRKDIETYTSIPIIGEIPIHKKNTEEPDSFVISENPENNDTRIAEALRMLEVNLKFMSKDSQVLMFTSATAGDGKTFLSGNFAVSLALEGKKVIVLDLDLRKKTQSKLVGKGQNTGISSYLSGQEMEVKNLIIKNAIYQGVDLIPAGNTPPNAPVLLMNERLERLISGLKLQYDYIILDVVPALIVSDAMIVGRVAEITIYVIREGIFDRRYLPELEKLYQEKKFNNMSIVINACREKNKYGYGYNYGYNY
jgi:capsular exopolysaccharide synthesis family protein